MSIYTNIRNGILASALVFGSWVEGADFTCPGNIDSSLCNQLQTMNDTDWIICHILLKDGVPTYDSGCGRGDTACSNHMDTSWVIPWRDSIVAETRLLFEKYDLRWPDDPYSRASVPLGDGRQDTISSQFHRPAGIYILYATKHSILSIVGEPYISDAELWVRPYPTPLLSRQGSKASVSPRVPMFNLKGQRIEGVKTPGIKIRGVSIER